jgi:hypothetical protein
MTASRRFPQPWSVAEPKSPSAHQDIAIFLSLPLATVSGAVGLV